MELQTLFSAIALSPCINRFAILVASFVEHTVAVRGPTDVTAAELLSYRSVVLALETTLSSKQALSESLL